MNRLKYLLASCLLALLVFSQFSCRNVRIQDHPEWKQYFDAYPGIGESCFEMYDNNKEIAMYLNKKRCSEQLIPGAEFDIFTAMSALSANVALDEKYKLPVRDSVHKTEDTLTLTQAFKTRNSSYFRQLAQMLDTEKMQHYLDTVQFGNRMMGRDPSDFFNNGSLLVSPDEMVGFMKRFYHGELPAFDQRSMRLVRDLMLQETKPEFKVYYRFATVRQLDTTMHWLVGFAEHIEQLRNPKTRKIENIPHPYFFAMNFTTKDNSEDWKAVGVRILKEILKANHVNQ